MVGLLKFGSALLFVLLLTLIMGIFPAVAVGIVSIVIVGMFLIFRE